jgi:hypothetical protein
LIVCWKDEKIADRIRLARYRGRGGFCEHGNEHLSTMDLVEFTGHVNDYYVLKEDFGPWN